ncbi:MAG: hypothetical protein H0U57_14330 [Tatlockia sp.]|nr:hypothetical protein [Tatlockia sp.]
METVKTVKLEGLSHAHDVSLRHYFFFLLFASKVGLNSAPNPLLLALVKMAIFNDFAKLSKILLFKIKISNENNHAV